MSRSEFDRHEAEAKKRGLDIDHPEQISGKDLRILASNLTWGKLRKEGGVDWIPITDLSVSHLKNILITQGQVVPLLKACIVYVFAKKVAISVRDGYSCAEDFLGELDESCEISIEEQLVNEIMGDRDA